jgi:hypothetical protein
VQAGVSMVFFRQDLPQKLIPFLFSYRNPARFSDPAVSRLFAHAVFSSKTIIPYLSHVLARSIPLFLRPIHTPKEPHCQWMEWTLSVSLPLLIAGMMRTF